MSMKQNDIWYEQQAEGLEEILARIEAKLDTLLAQRKKRAHKPVQDVPDPLFDTFWEIYPRKVGKPAAKRAWKALCLNLGQQQALIATARQWARHWQGSDKLFIPHPATWLNQRRFEDALEEAMPQREQLPRTDAEWVAWGAAKGLPPKVGESMAQYQARIKTR